MLPMSSETTRSALSGSSTCMESPSMTWTIIIIIIIIINLACNIHIVLYHIILHYIDCIILYYIVLWPGPRPGSPTSPRPPWRALPRHGSARRRTPQEGLTRPFRPLSVSPLWRRACSFPSPASALPFWPTLRFEDYVFLFEGPRVSPDTPQSLPRDSAWRLPRPGARRHEREERERARANVHDHGLAARPLEQITKVSCYHYYYNHYHYYYYYHYYVYYHYDYHYHCYHDY